VQVDNGIRKCVNCNIAYQWPKSQSTLKQQFCSVGCEQKELGFHIDSFIKEGAYGKKSDLIQSKSVKDDEQPPVPDTEAIEVIRLITKDDDDDTRGLVPA